MTSKLSNIGWIESLKTQSFICLFWFTSNQLNWLIFASYIHYWLFISYFQLCLLHLKADSSHLEACWYSTNSIKSATLFCWERNAKFHKNPKATNIFNNDLFLPSNLSEDFSFCFYRGSWVCDWYVSINEVSVR